MLPSQEENDVFPKNFDFGASLSGFQFESGSGKGFEGTDWFTWVSNRENVQNGIVSGDDPLQGPGYWEDFSRIHDLAQSAGFTMLRIGVEWARLFPRMPLPGQDIQAFLDREAVQRYRAILRDLHARNIKTMVCLNHFTLPSWLHDPVRVNRELDFSKGGWVHPDSPTLFADFAQCVVEQLDPDVEYWSTLNEPFVVASLGYSQRSAGFPPSIIRPEAFRTAWQNEAKAHRLAYDRMKKVTTKPVGIIYAFSWATGAPEACKALLQHANWDFMDSLEGKFDWIGVNYYSRVKVEGTAEDVRVLPGFGQGSVPNSTTADGRPTSDFGWETYPEGLYHLLVSLHERYAKPIWVTENGLADYQDVLRPSYIVGHMYAVERSIADGADVRGYLHWSLCDNYEWAVGYRQRFGLVDLDVPNNVLTPRASFFLFADIIRKRDLSGVLGLLHRPFDIWSDEQ